MAHSQYLMVALVSACLNCAPSGFSDNLVETFVAPSHRDLDKQAISFYPSNTVGWDLKGNRLCKNTETRREHLKVPALLNGDYKITGVIEIIDDEMAGFVITPENETTPTLSFILKPSHQKLRVTIGEEDLYLPLEKSEIYQLEVHTELGLMTLSINGKKWPELSELKLDQKGWSFSYQIHSSQAPPQSSFSNWAIQSTAPTLAPVRYIE